MQYLTSASGTCKSRLPVSSLSGRCGRYYIEQGAASLSSHTHYAPCLSAPSIINTREDHHASEIPPPASSSVPPAARSALGRGSDCEFAGACQRAHAWCHVRSSALLRRVVMTYIITLIKKNDSYPTSFYDTQVSPSRRVSPPQSGRGSSHVTHTVICRLL